MFFRYPMNDDSDGRSNQDTHNDQGKDNEIQNTMMYIGFTEHFDKRTILRHNITSNYRKHKAQRATKANAVKTITRKSVTT